MDDALFNLDAALGEVHDIALGRQIVEMQLSAHLVVEPFLQLRARRNRRVHDLAEALRAENSSSKHVQTLFDLAQ